MTDYPPNGIENAINDKYYNNNFNTIAHSNRNRNPTIIMSIKIKLINNCDWDFNLGNLGNKFMHSHDKFLNQ
eukprot:Awhi_evm1s6489